MTRPSLLLSRSTTLSPPPEADTDGERFASWLTRDLRAKGAPGPLSTPAPPPSVDSSNIEAAARAIEVPVNGASSDFARWLTNDLRPRGSSRPPDSLAPQLLPGEGEAVVSVAPAPESAGAVVEQTAPARSEAHEDAAAGWWDAAADQLSEEQRPGASGAPHAGGVPGLDDDDLAVLPVRPSRRLVALSSRRSGLGFAALGALVLLGSWFVCGVRGARQSEVKAELAAPPLAPPTALPPPPPDRVEEPALEVELETPARRARAAAPAAAPEPQPEDDPWMRGGPNVRRFADLPLPTLSKLAREEHERLRERDEEMRKKAKSARR